MNIADLADSYAAKTDEELLALAAERTQLTIEAQTALASELSRRRVSTEPEQNGSDVVRKAVKVSAQTDTSSLVRLKAGAFIEEVLALYNSNRRSFVQLAFPSVLLSFIAIQSARHEVHEIAQPLRMGFKGFGIPIPRFAILKMTLISGSGWFISWILFCIAFAAICSAVEQCTAGFQISIRESFNTVWERPGRFFGLSAILLGLFLALEIIVMVPISNWISPFLRPQFRHFSWTTYWLVIGYFEVAFIVLVLSRFGLAMPALILDDNSITDSFFRSYALTQGKWAILAVLLFKSIVGGYVAAMLPFWFARLIPAAVELPWWFGWVLSAFSILCVTVVEPVMFIGFALLYLKMTAVLPVRAESVTA